MLTSYVEAEDLERIQAALSLRKQYIQRVLPPTAFVLMVAGIIGLGHYDIQKVSDWIKADQPNRTQQTQSTHPAAVQNQDSQRDSGPQFESASGNTPRPTPASQSQEINTRWSSPAAPVKSVPKPTSQNNNPVNLVAPVGNAVAPVTRPVNQLTQPVLQPVAQAVQPVLQPVKKMVPVQLPPGL